MAIEISLKPGFLVMNGDDHEYFLVTLTNNGQGFSGEVNIYSDSSTELLTAQFGIDESTIVTKPDGTYEAGFSSDYVGRSKPPHSGPLPTMNGTIYFQYADDHGVNTACNVSIGALDE